MLTESNILHNIDAILSNYQSKIAEKMIFDLAHSITIEVKDKITEEYNNNIDFYKEENISLLDYADMESENIFDEVIHKHFEKITNDACWSIIFTAKYSKNTQVNETLNNLDFTIDSYNSLDGLMRQLAMNYIYKFANSTI